MKLRELLQQMKEVQTKIGASEPYICGGTPRDRYMGRLDNIADIDITTGDKTVEYLSQEFEIALRKKYNVKRTTSNDGHSTIFLGSFKMDFSSNFNAPGIDQHLLKLGIKNPNDMQREMFSRDFTCNALLLSFDLKNLVDPTHRGFKDIKDRVIKTCLDPQTTLTSSKNRVIRAIYLAAKLDFDIDPSIIEYVRKNPQTVQIATNKVMLEKLNEAFKRDADKSARLIAQMGLWNHIPIPDSVYPYYEKYLKGDIVRRGQRNYDLGKGLYENMDKYESVEKFRDNAPHDSNVLMADDNADYMLPPKEHGTSIYDWKNSPYQGTPKRQHADDNFLDFPIDDQVTPILGDSESFESPIKLGPAAGDIANDGISPGAVGLGDTESYPASAQIGGYLDKYLTQNDMDDKPESTLDFGYDLTDGAEESSDLNEKDLEILFQKYLNPSPNHGLYGLPDGVDLPDEDLGDPTDLNPDYGTRGPESLIYEDKWNI